MSRNSGWRSAVTAVLCVSLFAALGCGGGSSRPPDTNVRIDGGWNVELRSGLPTSAPDITLGLTLAQNTGSVSGTYAPYTGPSPATTACMVVSSVTAQGVVNSGNLVTLGLNDPASHTTITITGQANSTATQIDGTFSTVFGSVGGDPPCTNFNGTAKLTKK